MGAGAGGYSALSENAHEDMHVQFSEAMVQKNAATIPLFREEKKETAQTNQTFKIENVYLQADDCKTLFDFIRQLEFAVGQGVAV